MSKIYLDQSNLTLTVETDVALTGAIATLIAFIKPDGVQSSFLGSIVDIQNIEYIFSEPSELDVPGVWTFWAYVIFADGRNAPGEPEKIQVFVQGK